MGPFMPLEIPQVSEMFAAHVARVTLAFVHFLMLVQMLRPHKPFVANFAHVRSLPGMRLDVPVEVPLVRESLAARFALVRLRLVRVSLLNMFLQILYEPETSITLITTVRAGGGSRFFSKYHLGRCRHLGHYFFFFLFLLLLVFQFRRRRCLNWRRDVMSRV
jgi:hypothetical protein